MADREGFEPSMAFANRRAFLFKARLDSLGVIDAVHACDVYFPD